MTEQERLRCNAIDINGLNSSDRNRTEEVGFNAWLDEVSNPKAAGMQIARQHRHRKKCAVCEAVFLATRADAQYCSHKCQLRGNRRGLAFRGLPENISENNALQLIAA
jgi:predicted nucleic acid-binding Zn ribbon protein